MNDLKQLVEEAFANRSLLQDETYKTAVKQVKAYLEQLNQQKMDGKLTNG
jgi:hypothetical protein